MTYILTLYSVYLTITVILTIWVARTLFRNGKVFLIDMLVFFKLRHRALAESSKKKAS